MLLAAASTTEAMQEVAALFEKKSGAKVEINPGASNALAQQIIAGAPADVFLSANEKWADEVKKHRLAAEARPLLGNRLAIVVPRGNPAGVRSPADLTADSVKQVALAGEQVPAGFYADQALKSLDLAAKLAEAKKIVRGADVRITLSYVERGEVEAGIVYATDARISDKVETVYTFDPATHDALVYPAVLVKRDGAEPAAAAREFFEFLFSAEAGAVFRRHGFLPVGEPMDDAPARPRDAGER
jgi:molybdate transport system substrate-binding protein